MSRPASATALASTLAIACLGLLSGCEKAAPSGDEASAVEVSVSTSTPTVTPAANDSSPASDPVASSGPTSTTIPPDPYAGRRPPGAAMISFEPATTKFGIVEPKSLQKATVRIWNHGTTPLKIERWVTSCGCTDADDIAGLGIAPMSHLDFNIRMEMKSGLGYKKEKITIWFVGKSERPVVHFFEAETALAVRITPPFVDATQSGAGRLTIQSQDGEPFVIQRVQGGPPNIVDWTPGDAPRNTYQLNWTIESLRGRDQKVPWFMVIETDRADARLVDVRVRHATTAPVRPPGRPWVPKDQRAVIGTVRSGEPFEFTAKIEYAKNVVPDVGAAQVHSIMPGLEIRLSGTEVDGQFLVLHLTGVVTRRQQGLLFGEIQIGSSGFTTPLFLIGLVE